jgi:hypothetical protein
MVAGILVGKVLEYLPKLAIAIGVAEIGVINRTASIHVAGARRDPRDIVDGSVQVACQGEAMSQRRSSYGQAMRELMLQKRPGLSGDLGKPCRQQETW